MHTVTFIYRFSNYGTNSNAYFGKCIFKYNPDDTELDKEVHKLMLNSLNEYRKNRGYRLLRPFELRVGVMSYFESNFKDSAWVSAHDIKAFDFYSIEDKIYLNGRVLSYNKQTP